MGLFKSFIVSFVVFIGSNFIMNLLIIIAKGTPSIGKYFSNIGILPLLFIGSFFTIKDIGILPPGFNIIFGVNSGISFFNSNIFYGIMLILASFLPTLIASIIGGKIADTSLQAFIGFILAMILSSIMLIILYLINSAEMSSFVIFLKNYFTGIMIVIWIFIFGICNGLLWSGLAAMMGKEHKIFQREQNV